MSPLFGCAEVLPLANNHPPRFRPSPFCSSYACWLAGAPPLNTNLRVSCRGSTDGPKNRGVPTPTPGFTHARRLMCSAPSRFLCQIDDPFRGKAPATYSNRGALRGKSLGEALGAVHRSGAFCMEPSFLNNMRSDFDKMVQGGG